MKDLSPNSAYHQQDPLPQPPGSDIGAAIKGAAWYAAIAAAIGAMGSKIPGLNRIYNAGVIAEAKVGAVVGGFVGAIVGLHDNRVRRETVYPLKLENHILKHAMHETNTALQDCKHTSHVEKLDAEREQQQVAPDTQRTV